MRVLHLLKTSDHALWAMLQIRELARLGVEVHLALPPAGALIPAYEAAGIRLHPLQFDFPMRQPFRFPRMAQALRELVARLQPDLIHSHFVGTTLTMRLALGRRHPTPRVFQVPGPLHLEHALFRRGEIAVAGAPDYWIGSCEWTCRRYRALAIPAQRVFLSYYGRDVASLSPRTPGKLRRELGVGTEARLVGMVAYMYPPRRYLGQTRGLKGHEDLIDALAICLRTNPNITGVFIGGSWGDGADYERRVRAYACKCCGKRALFLGTRDDVPELYADLDVVVHPSHSENVGGAGESFLLGVPTVATNVGGFPDLVRPGETGWLVPPRKPRELANAILDALGDPSRARRMALTGQALARKLLDYRQTAREVLAIYQTILAGRRAG